MRLILLIFSFNLIFTAKCARILGVFPYHSKSHTILGQALFKELAKQGHEVCFSILIIWNQVLKFQVVYMSPFPMKNPPKNYTDIPLTDLKLKEAFESKNFFF
jgi:hypothetical protein